VSQEFDIVGIGNAIVDVITDVNDEFINQQELRKGLMSLVDLDTIKSLSNKIEIKANVSGGSVANSIVALAQNNIKSAFIGKVGKDEVGNSFIRGLEKEKVVFANQAQSDESETGRCLVMVTPDAQRTMSTYLGISQKLKSNDINEDVIAQSKITYLEGYLWDLDDAQEAIKKAIKISKEANRLVAFSVSDVFCIERFRESFLNLVKHSLSIISVFKFNVIIRSILFFVIYFAIINKNISLITIFPLFLLIIFLFIIFNLSNRENIKEFDASLSNIGDVRHY